MPDFRRVGRSAEDRAADYLITLGYTIVTRRYKARHGEIDLVALDGDLLVFVEVKFRRGATAHPEDAVDDSKMRAVSSAATEYLLAMGEPNRPFRCDLVAIDASGIRHTEDAFREPSERPRRTQDEPWEA